jgi:polysaccharide biosynthesis transport protein
MSLVEIRRGLWRGKLVGILVLVLVLSAVTALSIARKPDYRSTASVALLPDPSNKDVASFYGNVISSLLPTYLQFLASRSFFDGVAQDLPFKESGNSLQKHVFGNPVPNAAVIRITASAVDRRRAAIMAEITADHFAAGIRGNGLVQPEIIDHARVPTHAVESNSALIFAAGIILALALAAAAALAWDRIFDRLETSREVADASGLPVLGVVPRERGMRGGRRRTLAEIAGHRLQESIRILSTNVLFAAGTDHQIIVVTCPDVDDGKAIVTASMAIVMADLGMSVLLVDANVYRPQQHEFFGIPNDVGLTRLDDTVDPASLVTATPYRGLSLLPAGDWIESGREEARLYFRQLPKLAGMADVVLVDAAPLRTTSGVRYLAASASGVVLAVRAGATRSQDLSAAVHSLSLPGTHLLGTILTRARERDPLELAATYSRFTTPAPSGD